MTNSLMDDAFAHHAWATERLVDACRGLTNEQLEAPVPGTYGSIIQTLRHMVGADAWYLSVASGDRSHMFDEDAADLDALRAAMGRQGAGWAALLGSGVDADTVLKEVDDDDGFQRHAALGIQLAQALHHGTDHRSQVCTALTGLGLEPPDIDVWVYGLASGRSVDIPPSG